MDAAVEFLSILVHAAYGVGIVTILAALSYKVGVFDNLVRESHQYIKELTEKALARDDRQDVEPERIELAKAWAENAKAAAVVDAGLKIAFIAAGTWAIVEIIEWSPI